MSDDIELKEDEAQWFNGYRMAWTLMLGNCLRHLRDAKAEDTTLAMQLELAEHIAERELAVNVLRELCKEFGDNDFPDDLHLSDIIDKHLGNYLHDAFDVFNAKE